MKFSTSLALCASILSFSTAALAGPGPLTPDRVLNASRINIIDDIALEEPVRHVGEVMCNINTSPVFHNGYLHPAGTLVRERTFIDYLQVGPTNYHEVLDDGFGSGKALALVLMDCQAQAHSLCDITHNPLPPYQSNFHISNVRISGNLFTPAQNFNCN